MKLLPIDIPKIVPPIKIKKSEFYKLVIKDSDNVLHYFDNEGNYDGYSYDLPFPIEDNPN